VPAAAANNSTGKGGPTITMVPAVLEGLLASLLLIFFAILGLSCVLSIQTPSILHSVALPAGKEF
jgi:hypothetical protein